MTSILMDNINEEVDKFITENPNYRTWPRPALIGLLRERKKMMIYEGLIKSEPRDLVIDKLKKFNATLNMDWNRIDFTITNGNFESFKNQLNDFFTLLNVCGWYVSRFYWYTKDIDGETTEHSEKFISKELILEKINKNPIKIDFLLEAKYDSDITSRVPNKMYHVSPKRFRNKIAKYGLVPRSASKLNFHPERVYFAFTLGGAKFIAKQLNEKKPTFDKPINDDVFDIYEYESKNSDIKFMKDPNYNEGCFTTDNISPNKLKIIDTINFKQKII